MDTQGPNKENYQKSEQNFRVVKLAYIPKIGPKLRRDFRKFDIKTAFISIKNLETILCQTKSKLLRNSYPVAYKLTSSYNPVRYSDAT